MGSPRLRDVLHSITAARQRGDSPIVLFDLDSTLLLTGARHLSILRAFLDHSEDRDEEWAALRERAGELVPSDFGYEISDPLPPLRRETHDALRRFWQKRYFTNRACLVDEPAPGAVDYVSAVHRAGARVWYLTGRPEDGMRRGTEETLVARGFPLHTERVTLTLRPPHQRSDHEFKAGLTRRIAREGEVVGQFENEPAHANAFLRAFPKGLHFLVGDVHSASAPAPDPAILRTEDFVLP